MKRKIHIAPSTSFKITNIQYPSEESDIISFFKQFGEIERFIMHYALHRVFLHRATLVFSSIESARKVASRFLGRKCEPFGFKLYYHMLPYAFSLTHEPVPLPMMTQLDDEGPFTTPSDPRFFIRDWCEIKQIFEVPQSLSTVSLRFNYIKSVSFQSQCMTVLHLKGNDINGFDPGITFPHLRVLDLSCNLMTETFDFLKICPSIENLNLSYNYLKSISNTITQLKALEKLFIQFNEISLIPKLPKSVRIFQANNNAINHIDDFKLQFLQSYDLSSNMLETVPTFTGSAFDRGCLIFNSIKVFPMSVINDRTTIVNLSRNNLEMIPPDLFKMKHVQILDLSVNQITRIPQEISHSLISELNLSENPISRLPLLPNTITTLKLAFCEFEDLGHCLDPLNIISLLFVSGNSLIQLPDLPELVELHAACNSLIILPNIDRPYSQPVTIDVPHNRLKSIPTYQVPFKLLDVSFNPICELPMSIFKKPFELKVSHTPLSLKITDEMIDNLSLLDIVGTDCVFVNSPRKPLKSVFVSYPADDLDLTQIAFDVDDLIGYSETKGARRRMEDFLILRKHYGTDTEMYGMLDGHGGKMAAKLAALIIPELPEIDFDYFVENFQRLLVGIGETSGTTMEVVMKHKKSIEVVHLGDSKCVLMEKNGSIRFETREENLLDRKEFERVRSEKVKIRDMRTSGILAMTASLGDVTIGGVKHTPEVYKIDRSDDDGWIILGCDGIWDAIATHELKEFVSRGDTPQEIATIIRDAAFERGSEDNLSVIVIELR